ncbi:hypothetical protein [Rubrivivax gelatinosus]|uniref:Uncharacterized protein n=1 Tax=Rubrivivax gelatinosus TaxID=28068 RepID=A0ABS1E2S9_RUBGE|nr:hypothetical protein [Rubrivivax gelatinosus]MBK1715230.1 hypothetical protein [Rubrivivax gelatinosus]
MRQAITAWALAAAASAGAAELTPTETLWLRGAAPVLAAAEARGLPLDIVVQPQPAGGLAPLALGFVDGRCKFVLSMRANPEAEATLERLPAGHENAAFELMAAHEIAHCERHVQGAWHGPVAASADAQRQAMAAERREEAWADLAGLAWIQARRPAEYAALHAWLVAERRRERVPGSEHDTLDWVDAAAGGLDTAAPAAAAAALWARVAAAAR